MSYPIPPAGISPVSFFAGSDLVEQARPPAMLADTYDVETGELASISAYLHPVDAAVREQFRLWRGTGAAVADQGQQFRRITKVTDSTARELEDEARRLLTPFVARGEVAILAIETEAPGAGATPDTGRVTVHYRNLLTGRRREVSA